MDNNFDINDFNKDKRNITLPPRSTIHSKEASPRDYKKSQIITILVSFVFLVSLSVFVYIQLSPTSENAFNHDLDSSQTDATKNLEDNSDQAGNDNTGNLSDQEENGQDIDLGSNDNQTDMNQNQDYDAEPRQESEDVIHIVQSGENLYRISMQYYSTGKYYEALAKYNGLPNADAIYTGFKLKIPKIDLLVLK